MARINTVSYRKAYEEAHSSVDPITLTEAIERVYDMWIRAKEAGVPIDFHSYFGLSLFDMGIDDLFGAEPYRKALGGYFNRQALKALAKMRAEREARQLPELLVEAASATRARIRVSSAKSFEFRTTRKRGELKWSHVVKNYEIIHIRGTEDQEIDHDTWWRAHRKALAVMNSRR